MALGSDGATEWVVGYYTVWSRLSVTTGWAGWTGAPLRACSSSKGHSHAQQQLVTSSSALVIYRCVTSLKTCSLTTTNTYFLSISIRCGPGMG